MPVIEFHANWRGLSSFHKLELPGIAHAQILTYISTSVIGQEMDLVNDLIYQFGKSAGQIPADLIVKNPQKIASLYEFIKTNWKQ